MGIIDSDQPNNRTELGANGYLRGPDGVEHFYRFWIPERTRAILLALHGLGAHGEWYEGLGDALLPRGVATLAPDLRGHGLTRWDLGMIPDPDVLLRDLDFWIAELTRHFPGVPLHLLGTSMGGCLAVSVAARHPELKGLILISPAFRPIYLRAREKAAMVLSVLLGRAGQTETPLGRGLAICGDELRLQWLRQDPLAQRALPARSHWNVGRLIRQASRELTRTRPPILCLQGARDPVTSAETNRRLFESRADARFVLWDDGHHDLALEAGDKLSGQVADWVRHHGLLS
jgi:alpha-beta hydrolase superfamily lysophospholipase